MQNTIKILDVNNIKYHIKDDKIFLEDRYLNLSNKKLVCTLDVSMIENLKGLDCSQNKLTEIICNENLKELYCHKNELSNFFL